MNERSNARIAWPAGLIAFFASSSSVAILVPESRTAVFNLVVVLAAVAAVLGHVLVRSDVGLPEPREFMLVGLFTLAAFPAAFSAASTDYGATKTQAMVLVIPLALAAPLLVIRTHRQRTTFLWTFVLVNGVGVLLTLPHALQGTTGRIGIQGESGPIVAGRAAGIVLVAALAVLLTSKDRQKLLSTSASVSGITAGSLVLVGSASRGPFLASAIAASVLVVRLWAAGSGSVQRRATGRWRIVGVLIGFSVVAYGLFASRLPARLTTGIQDDTARRHLFSVAWEHGGRQPFGNGWGSFPGLLGQTGRAYPHNVALELWVEGGWLITTAFVIVAALGFRRLWIAEGAESSLLLALLLFSAMNAAVSGDIIGNRTLFVLLGIGLAATMHRVDYVETVGRRVYPEERVRGSNG